MDGAKLNEIVQATGCAEVHHGATFLCDPHGSNGERSEVAAVQSAVCDPPSERGDGWLCIRTGGSSGGIRFARHDERTLRAAVTGFCAHFGLGRVNAVDVLPPHHVSGLMARVRCAATGGMHVPWSWSRLEAGERPPVDAGDWVLSLVPTQLHRLMESAAAQDWLRGFRLIFVGGGPLWPQLADAAAQAEIPLAPSYGMTETAAMVTALRPAEFLSGMRSSGSPLPHVRVTISAEGLVRVESESLFRGYWPAWRVARDFTTEDLGRIDARGHLHISGRRDALIITGGKKVQPADVEAALRASGEFDDVAVIGLPDPVWGECVVACYPAGQRSPNTARSIESLAAWQRPKRFVAMGEWPRNAQGKVDRAALRRLAG